jgi:hypothetical protein
MIVGGGESIATSAARAAWPGAHSPNTITDRI